MKPDLDRRTFLKGAGALGLLALLPKDRLLQLASAAPGPGQPGRFLTAHELDTLRVLSGRFVPGPLDGPGPNNLPPATDPGAREARCAEAIDILLAAFSLRPARIHAGGPFSNRAGATHDDFADFVPLDAHAELGWRIRIEGTRGIKAREFAGPVTGLQDIYRAGLGLLDQRAHTTYGHDFKDLSGAQQDGIIDNEADQAVQSFVAVALTQVIEAMYGPPEYGGNQGLVGWSNTRYDGDVQPRGYTDAQVTQPGAGIAPAPPPGVDLGGLMMRNLSALRPRPAPRDAPWLGRRGYPRG